MEELDKNEVIDLRKVFKKILGKKKLFLKVWAVTFVLACAWILPVPRTYVSEVMLAPELDGSSTGGTLSSLASSFGINVGSMMGGSDALYPLLYPDLMSSNDFLVSLFGVKVKTLDGAVDTDYYTYLLKHQKMAFYKVPFHLLRQQLKKMFPKQQYGGTGSGGEVNPFFLTERQDALVKSMQDLITCSVDKKTDVITITVIDQDPLVCATMADSVRVRLQNFITAYRTSKVRGDKEYYERLVDEAYKNYQQSVARYTTFCDSHRNMTLQSLLSKRDDLEQDMQMKFNTYNVMSTQLEAAKAKVQEKTPAFTILQGASVPVKPDKPKRMLFVAAMLFLATIGTIGDIVFQDIWNRIPSLTE